MINRLNLSINLNIWRRWQGLRQLGLNRLLSGLYARPVVVAPQHAVCLAGMVVLWAWGTEAGLGNGQRMLLMVRPKNTTQAGKAGAARRARFISCLGVGAQPDMPTALRQVLTAQLGPVFTRLIPPHALQAHNIVAAPLLSLTDEDTGAQMPLQVMAWAAELRPHQESALQVHDSLELVWVAEDALGSNQISPTHRAVWQQVAGQLPQARKQRPLREDSVQLVEAEEALTTPDSRKPLKTLH